MLERLRTTTVAAGLLCAAMLGSACTTSTDANVVASSELSQSETPAASPEPTATAAPEPTATAVPEPTATAVPEPTATAVPEPTAIPEPTAVSVITEVDQAIAERAVLKIDDLPSGWIDSVPNESDPERFVGIPACDATVALREADDETGLAKAHFDSDDNRVISVDIGVFTTKAQAANFVDVYDQDDLGDCLEVSMVRFFDIEGRDDVELRVGVERISVEPVGDRSVGWQVKATLFTADGDVTFVIDFEIVSVGRAAVVLQTVGIIIPVFDRDEYAALMVERLRADPDF